MALSEKAVETLAAGNQMEVGPVKKALAGEMAGDYGIDDPLRVPFRMGTTLFRSMCHASRFFREVRDNGIFYAGKCPECGHTLFPPIRPTCLSCIKKGKLSEYEPVEFGPVVEGSVVAWSKLVRGTSKQLGKGEMYPSLVKVDGADNAHWQIVYPSVGKEVKVGARVRSVLVPQEDRMGVIGDYSFQLL